MSCKGANASYLYYRHGDFGKSLDDFRIEALLGFEDKNLAGDKNSICGIPYVNYFRIKGAAAFSLKTTYPGLIVGAGYNHPAGEKEADSESDFQLGFYFDHTTGMPVIPGSTVKGVLKSVFPKGEASHIVEEKLKYINGLLDNVTVTKDNWEKLFEKGNIFHDAFISGITDDGRIFAEDYITPHNPGEPMGIFKNPKPLRFLKVAPGVVFTFQFVLRDSRLDNGHTVSAEQKKEIFRQILLDFGVGAKRNVGYGNLVEGGF